MNIWWNLLAIFDVDLKVDADLMTAKDDISNVVSTGRVLC